MKRAVFFIYILSFFAFGQEMDFYPVEPMHSEKHFGVFVDKLEYKEKSKSLEFEISSFYGGDYQKLWFELEGEKELDIGGGKLDRADLLLGKAISSFWDIRVGVGYAGDEKSGRSKLVLGIKGLAPYGFDVDGIINLTHKGELYGKLEVGYELLLTQRLILQPNLELLASSKRIEPLEIGSGLSKTSLALRLRYEIIKEFAPYIGVSWDKYYGQTKELLGEDGSISLILGTKFWF